MEDRQCESDSPWQVRQGMYSLKVQGFPSKPYIALGYLGRYIGDMQGICGDNGEENRKLL